MIKGCLSALLFAGRLAEFSSRRPPGLYELVAILLLVGPALADDMPLLHVSQGKSSTNSVGFDATATAVSTGTNKSINPTFASTANSGQWVALSR
jgi:hypothetical protein